MYCLTPSLDAGDAQTNLRRLLAPAISADRFHNDIHRLQSRFVSYATTGTAPLAAPGLIVTPEIRCQCEFYLPIAEISAAFRRLYRSALAYPPILASTPFHNALSWADVIRDLPARCRFSANPSRLLAALLADHGLLVAFLFASFLPRRFYGGSTRYPQQMAAVGEWLLGRDSETVCCLDAACGIGEESYELAELLMVRGYGAEQVRIEGWTIEPLEVWAAAHCCLPHDPDREAEIRQRVVGLFTAGYHHAMRFRCRNLLDAPESAPFDLIICNGLLGGPIMHDPRELKRVIGGLAARLAPGGLLLAADRFHGGWKRKCPQDDVRALFRECGLDVATCGEGIRGLRC